MAHDHKHKFSAIVLAAGEGKRMRSSLPKVMHKLAGKPLIGHVLAELKPLRPEKTIVVVASKMDTVEAAGRREIPGCEFVIQDRQLGTGHAVRCAELLLGNYKEPVLVLYGDTPLLTSHTLHHLIHAMESADIVVLGMRPRDPAGYGRLVVDSMGQLEEIIEYRDATEEQKRLPLCNSGVMAVSGRHLFELLKSIDTNNAAGEYYLTDIVAKADERGLHCKAFEADPDELQGINSRAQLAEAEGIMQRRLRLAAMEQGATLIDPYTVYFQADTVVSPEIIIHPHVVFGPGVTVEGGVEIRSFCHIEGAHIKSGATIGPFARLRPGTVIGEGAHVGNFVEMKNTTMGRKSKANHLSYVGDSTVGEGANIGAGTITCNYDGVNKHKTTIGAGAFIGSNTSLVAPVTVGADAVVAAGSVITENVEPGALAFGRAQQTNKPGRAPKKKSS